MGTPYGACTRPNEEAAQLTEASAKIEIHGGRYPDHLEAQTNR
ncbi:hypothetical protein [Streptomyces sp. YIM S03343]